MKFSGRNNERNSFLNQYERNLTLFFFLKILFVLKNVRLDTLMRIAAKCVNIQHLGKGVLKIVFVKNTCVTSCVGAKMASIHFLYTVLNLVCNFNYKKCCHFNFCDMIN